MPYFPPSKHQCSKCNEIYIWDCLLPTFPGEMPTVVKVIDCVHAKLVSQININNCEFPLEIKVEIMCPNCKHKDFELLTIGRETYP